PGGTRLQFGPRASVRLNLARLWTSEAPVRAGLDDERLSALFVLEGDRITFEGMNVDFTGPNGMLLGSDALRYVIYGEHVSELRFRELRAVRNYPDPAVK